MNCAIIGKMEIVEPNLYNLFVGHIFSYRLHFAQKQKKNPIIAILHAQQDPTIAHPINYLRLLSISLTRTQVLLSKIGNTSVCEK